MFEIKDFQTLYNMMVASFIILTFALLYDAYIEKGEFVDVIALLTFFKGAKIVIIAWLVLSCIFFSIIIVTKIALRTSKWVWMPLYIIHPIANLSVATLFATSTELGFASSIIIMCESVRMIMKAHSYFRTKMLYLSDNPYKDFEFRDVKVINTAVDSLKDDEKSKDLKINIREGDIFYEIKKLSYFFHAPTLIYRDSYVLTPVRSFRKIIVHLVNFLACTYYGTLPLTQPSSCTRAGARRPSKFWQSSWTSGPSPRR
jgi:sterol O-acyltransferase